MAKLTSYDKATIKEWYATQEYSQMELAEIYGVSRSTIQRVLNEADFLPDNYEVGNVPTPDEHEMGTENESNAHDGHEGDSDLPPEWFAWALVVLTAGGAAFVGWLVYHAIN